MEKEKVKCVIFDFNGTLFFDYNENKDAWNIVALKHRGSEFGEEEYLSMMGKTDRRCAEYIKRDGTDQELDALSEEKEDIYLRLLVERNIRLEKDAVSFIEECKRRGVRVMIASSAPKMNMDWYIKNLNLGDYFDICDIVAGRDDIPSKPAPAGQSLARDMDREREVAAFFLGKNPVRADQGGDLYSYTGAAGGAAHLAGVVAAHTLLPVIGIPVEGGAFHGMDALLATVQMPGGIPVATVGVGSGGAVNAGLLAAQMIALADDGLRQRLADDRAARRRKVEEADAAMQAEQA